MQSQNIKKEIGRTILLNPGPATTSKTVKEALIVEDICPREQEFGELLAKVRKGLVSIVNGQESHETVLLGGSGTGAVESCLTSCTNGQEKILIINNGAYGERMEQICSAYSIPFHSLKFNIDEAIDLNVIANFLRGQQEQKTLHRFRVMAFIHHETTTGILNPLSELNKLAKSYGLKSMVDAMSSYAGVPIDLKKDNVDYLISSSNKCIQGMAGLGIVIVTKDELKTISNFIPKNFYFNLYKNYKSQHESGQFLFTPPVQILYSLNQAIEELVLEGGPEQRFNRYSFLYQLLHTEMKKLGFNYLIDENHHSKILTTYFEPENPNYNFDKMHDFLFKQGITIYPGKVSNLKTFRVSNLGDLNEKDILDFLNSLKDYLLSEGILPHENAQHKVASSGTFFISK